MEYSFHNCRGVVHAKKNIWGTVQVSQIKTPYAMQQYNKMWLLNSNLFGQCLTLFLPRLFQWNHRQRSKESSDLGAAACWSSCRSWCLWIWISYKRWKFHCNDTWCWSWRPDTIIKDVSFRIIVPSLFLHSCQCPFGFCLKVPFVLNHSTQSFQSFHMIATKIVSVSSFLLQCQWHMGISMCSWVLAEALPDD